MPSHQDDAQNPRHLRIGNDPRRTVNRPESPHRLRRNDAFDRAYPGDNITLSGVGQINVGWLQSRNPPPLKREVEEI